MRSELTFEEIEGSIQLIDMHKVTGNAFSLIAGLQEGGVDALVGKVQDVKLLLTVTDSNMHEVFCRVVGLLKSMSCKVQERKNAPGSGPGRLRLFSYLNVASGLLTFTTELQAVPPQLVAVTLRLERGDMNDFAAMCKYITYSLCDLLRSYEWAVLSRPQAEAASTVAPEQSPFSPSLSQAISNAFTTPSSPPASPGFGNSEGGSLNTTIGEAKGMFPASPPPERQYTDPVSGIDAGGVIEASSDTTFTITVTDVEGALRGSRPVAHATTGDPEEAVLERAARHAFEILLGLATQPLLLRHVHVPTSGVRKHRIAGCMAPRDNSGLVCVFFPP